MSDSQCKNSAGGATWSRRWLTDQKAAEEDSPPSEEGAADSGRGSQSATGDAEVVQSGNFFTRSMGRFAHAADRAATHGRLNLGASRENLDAAPKKCCLSPRERTFVRGAKDDNSGNLYRRRPLSPCIFWLRVAQARPHLYRGYPRLTQHPLNLKADELLGAVVERLLKAMREARRTIWHEVPRDWSFPSSNRRFQMEGGREVSRPTFLTDSANALHRPNSRSSHETLNPCRSTRG